MLSDSGGGIQNREEPSIESLPVYRKHIKLIALILFAPPLHITYYLVEIIRTDNNKRIVVLWLESKRPTKLT